jgi:hypothetical protein
LRKIYYDEGSPELTVVELGKFLIGIPKEVSNDEIADLVVKRGQFKYWKEPIREIFTKKEKVVENPKKENIEGGK